MRAAPFPFVRLRLGPARPNLRLWRYILEFSKEITFFIILVIFKNQVPRDPIFKNPQFAQTFLRLCFSKENFLKKYNGSSFKVNLRAGVSKDEMILGLKNAQHKP